MLQGIESRISEKMVKINYGTTRTDDPATHRYYIIKQSSNVYTAQDDIVMIGYNPPEYVYAGEMAYETRFLDLVSKENYWFTPIPEGEGDTTLRMKQFLMADIKLVEISYNNKPPKGCNKKFERCRSVKNEIGRYR